MNGKIVWTDLTVINAVEIRDFYHEVLGWTHDSVSMGVYEDYCMKSDDGQVVAGVCHARESNASMPAQWLIYIQVENVESSAKKAVELGGKIVEGPRNLDGKPFCVVQDPAGAMLALIEA